MKKYRRGPYQGLYKIKFPEKFIKPKDNFMKSYKNGFLIYKSSLELKAFIYCDLNPKIKNWSVECFAIPYLKPTDGKMHRYYPDILIEFVDGSKFMVEIKSFNETILPKSTNKNYVKQIQTYAINKSKWEFANKFCKANNFIFKILTEKEL